MRIDVDGSVSYGFSWALDIPKLDSSIVTTGCQMTLVAIAPIKTVYFVHVS